MSDSIEHYAAGEHPEDLDPEVRAFIEAIERGDPAVAAKPMPVEPMDPDNPISVPTKDLPPNWRETLKSWLG